MILFILNRILIKVFKDQKDLWSQLWPCVQIWMRSSRYLDSSNVTNVITFSFSWPTRRRASIWVACCRTSTKTISINSRPNLSSKLRRHRRRKSTNSSTNTLWVRSDRRRSSQWPSTTTTSVFTTTCLTPTSTSNSSKLKNQRPISRSTSTATQLNSHRSLIALSSSQLRSLKPKTKVSRLAVQFSTRTIMI